ncbi:ABC transporter permease [Saccharomonospora piscinae]|uniref:ABC transporter permease n=1 Tax=Saccharomonospora piscinae TaxID=687388 RepID=UPI00046659FB|nr:ABC transporter permease [Saccharomonospora piscinae]
MTATAAPEHAPQRETSDLRTATRVFGSLLSRDFYVIGQDFSTFLVKTLLQPFAMLFIFGVVLVELGFVAPEFAQLLFPGVIALNTFIGALQSTAMPMVMDFSFTKEIEDRLLAPVSGNVVALEKVVFGAFRGLLSGLAMVPIGFLIMDGVSWEVSGLLPGLMVLVLCALSASGVGMIIGTFVPPQKIDIVFTSTITPLMFTGATWFPWHGLDDLLWFQIVCGFNPLTYASEGLRDVLLDSPIQSIPLWVDVLAIVGMTTALIVAGLVGFRKRAVS